jgi:hypothetical protein
MISGQWKDAVSAIGGMTAEFAGDCTSIAISAPNRLVVTLKAAYNKEWCERPDIKRQIEQSMARVTGVPVQIQFVIAPQKKQTSSGATPVVSRRQKMREVEKHPLVEETMRLFEAEVTRLDDKKNP